MKLSAYDYILATYLYYFKTFKWTVRDVDVLDAVEALRYSVIDAQMTEAAKRPETVFIDGIL